MPSQIAQIADAVKAAINAATLSQEVSAERVYVPLKDMAALDTLQVLVVPTTRTIRKLTRTAKESDVRIDIGILKRISADPKTEAANAELDPLLQLAEEVHALFGPGEYGPGKWFDSEIPEALFDTDRLMNQKTFITVFTPIFRLF